MKATKKKATRKKPRRGRPPGLVQKEQTNYRLPIGLKRAIKKCAAARGIDATAYVEEQLTRATGWKP